MITRLLIVAIVIAAVVAVILATGWADDHAKPGTRGRGVTVTEPGR